MENKFYIEGITKVEQRILKDIWLTENELYNAAEKLGAMQRAELYDQNILEKFYDLENQLKRITNNYLSYNSVKK